MPRFLGLKSYLTTNRSNITKQQTTKSRRSRLTKWGLLREEATDRLKCPLCFCIPCFVGAVVLLVVVGVYVTTPYLRGQRFELTQCTVEEIEFSKKGSCSLRTEQFEPCFKIIVNYKITDLHKDIKSVLMENEQVVTHCDKCSYTFGKGGLFEKTQGCSSNPRSCVEIYNKKYGKINSIYPCYYDPENPKDVFRQYKISHFEVIYQTLLPALFILLYILGIIFVRYDDNKRRKINRQIKLEKHRHVVGIRRHNPDTTSDSKSNSSLTSDSPSSSASTAAIYRVRKKKMPCTKAHAFFARDDEDVIMEEKPISPRNKRTSNVFMEVNIDNLAPRCACANHQSLSNGFELARLKESFRPVVPTQHHYRNQLKQSTRALRYLPESIV